MARNKILMIKLSILFFISGPTTKSHGIFLALAIEFHMGDFGLHAGAVCALCVSVYNLYRLTACASHVFV